MPYADRRSSRQKVSLRADDRRRRNVHGRRLLAEVAPKAPAAEQLRILPPQ
jgi:hypothetical protein